MLHREEVDSFADSMETKLLANDYKGTWPIKYKEGDVWWFFFRLIDEVDELRRAITSGVAIDIKDEATDVGNFALMIHDLEEKNAIRVE